MTDAEIVALLQWALPRLGMRWRGFRKVRGQVRKRVARRVAELGLENGRDYREYVESQTDEWARLDAMCRITISRFYRDRGLFEQLVDVALPRLAAQCDGRLRVWCAGCAGGEEPYTLSILWKAQLAPRFSDVELAIVATDASSMQLERARTACYPGGALRELPEALRRLAFERQPDGAYRLLEPFREGVAFIEQDIREAMPDGPFELILCRYLAFTYFDEPLQRRIARELKARLAEDGMLVIGNNERLPEVTTV